MGEDAMRKACVFLLLLLAVGCRTKLNDESVVNVGAGESQYRMVEPISKEQKVNVSAKANSGTFNIYVFLEKDKAEAEKEIDKGKTGDKVLASKQKATDADLQATIPANQKAVVMLTSGDGKKAEVKLKISN
jgi:hypothetical protein